MLLAGVSTWLKYGGPEFQIGDTRILGLVLLVLRASLPDTPFEGVIPMLTGLAKLIAHSLFALRRSGASVLSLIVVTTVATAFATVGAATLLDGRRVR